MCECGEPAELDQRLCFDAVDGAAELKNQIAF
jgi:hypothetical protein